MLGFSSEGFIAGRQLPWFNAALLQAFPFFSVRGSPVFTLDGTAGPLRASRSLGNPEHRSNMIKSKPAFRPQYPGWIFDLDPEHECSR